MSEQSFEMIAKTFQGLEEVLAKELTSLGANDIEIGRRMVSFSGDKEMMYKANFCLRTAIRILKPIKHFTAKDADEVYEQIKAIHWEDYLDTDRTFAVEPTIFSEEFRHSKFVAYKVKDAIVDYFREKTGNRPGVRVNKPDVLLNIHIAETKCTLSLDSSGESLHRRGYRQEAVEAPLNEVLAAGMILMTGWNGECDLIDPMCGSGTIPIEAALIARNIAPGIFRKEFAFEKWNDFDQNLFDTIYNDDSQEREFTHKIYGYDNSPKANEIATHNIKAAGVSKDIVLKLQPFQQFEQPAEKSVIITNPPYGERISTNDLLGLYSMIGERLKHAFAGNNAWILSYREECFDQIGLKPTRKIPLFNGALDCEFRQYEIFDGKYKEFREGGEGLSKELKLASGERREIKSTPRERREFRPRERREFRDGEKREFNGERRRFDGEHTPRNFRDGERREFKPRERREYKDGENHEFKPRGRKDFGETRTPRSGESYPERKKREEREKA
ncbi:class I SAM-dependent RNA methyltransferase [Bacteroides helcogenes]|uniref:rRNA (Guanine-N(2)-)-methyltransferase n=1 Tax=Bacteroides helcogenes (strain ATCC 35417 / DSM 20613 / JCM 6297 / CCUG 15421 / P 36-108) TaxID=693979 RepID=E6SNY6_BACT6|nr:THUMP domain-containing protein [Bacteroides helcogenes]ADV42804.1 rRNA (guanine-N(2)-)-methyltransferase [Bacteroides helcogenes P 36-108]MDY5239634.1 THUMP domain-containing protein [Bacteroides helcogenes]